MEVYRENRQRVGAGSVSQQGEDLHFALQLALPPGLWRIVAQGETGELVLAVLEGGRQSLHRCFSRRLTAELGAVKWAEARRVAGTRKESEWRAAGRADAADLPPLPPGTLYGARADGGVLAMPLEENAPFPWTERFCFARVGVMAGRRWAFYRIDAAGRLQMP